MGLTEGRFGTLLGATILCEELDRIVAAYDDALGYRVAATGHVGAERASAWRAPAAHECQMATLHPESGGPRFVRFVECSGAASPSQHATTGWNAVELIVQDLDRLADRLAARSDFSIIGAPAVLDFDFTDKIRAMQVVGPAGELIYFTMVDGEVPGFDLPVARCSVDAPFVAILGTRDIDVSAAWYSRMTGNDAASFDAPVGVISNAHALPPTYRHRLATLSLPTATLIEIDALPLATTADRGFSGCGLPRGIAIVTLAGRHGDASVAVGTDGELIELALHADPS